MESLPLKISNNSKHLKETLNIKSALSQQEKTKLAKAAQDFESLLTSMMLKSMNKTTGGMFGENNYGGDILDTVFQNEIASNITKSKSFGVANSIFKRITGEELTNDLLPKSIKPMNIYNSSVEKKITPSYSATERLSKYENLITEAADKYGIDKNLIKSIILTESAANENAVSKANAKGLMQLMDSTAADMNVKNSFDPRDNINGGTKYFSKMLRQYDGDLRKALAAYNAGPGNVDKYDGIPPFKETQNYVSRVLGYYKSME